MQRQDAGQEGLTPLGFAGPDGLAGELEADHAEPDQREVDLVDAFQERQDRECQDTDRSLHLEPSLRPCYPRSRWTVRTSLRPSIRLMTRASCDTEATWSVAVTIAVWSGFTWTAAATMLTLFSATTWVMSLSSPVRSYASTRIAIG